MKETGLMFKAPLVRAILSGQKVQTRRIVKPQPAPGQGMVNAAYCGDCHLWLRDGPCDKSDPAYEWRCPFGRPGDRIYVRETWQGPLMSSKEWEDHYFSEADDFPAKFRAPAYCQYAADGGPPPEFMTMDDELVARWKPSIHMPKWAARIWLEITGVRVERLQQITDAECWTEGAIVEARPDQFSVHSVIATDGKSYLSPRGAFSALWESTGGDWAANPWVWVIDFKRIEVQAKKED